jgi:hypothetical protein
MRRIQKIALILCFVMQSNIFSEQVRHYGFAALDKNFALMTHYREV